MTDHRVFSGSYGPTHRRIPIEGLVLCDKLVKPARHRFEDRRHAANLHVDVSDHVLTSRGKRS